MNVIKSTKTIGGLELDCYTVIGKDKCLENIKESKLTIFLYHYFNTATLLSDHRQNDYSNSCKETKLPSAIVVSLDHTSAFNSQDYVDSAIEEFGGEKVSL